MSVGTTPERRTVEVLFTRHDGAQLAMVRGRLIERAAPDAPPRVVGVLEGSRAYRHQGMLAYARAHGFLEPEGALVDHDDPGLVGEARGQLQGDGPDGQPLKRVHVTVEHREDVNGVRTFRAQVVGSAAVHNAPSLEAALAAAVGLPPDAGALQALTDRIAARLEDGAA